MATLTISSFNGKASRSTITFSYSVDLKPATDVYSSSTLQIQQKETAGTISRSVSGVDSATGGNNSGGTVTGTYTRVEGTDGPTAHTVSLTCYYNVLQRSREWETYYGDWQPYGPPALFMNGVGYFTSFIEEVTTTAGYQYYPVYNSTTQVYDAYRIPVYRQDLSDWGSWTSWETVSSNNALTQTVGTYYKSPKNFTFNHCSSGQKWKVNEGLQSLITNIYDFSDYATQWKAWDTQSSVSSCPNFNRGNLSASNLNSIYNYVNGTSPYSSGEIVAASMFNNLASAIKG